MSALPQRWILYPMLAMVLLTVAVGVLVYRRRIDEMRRRKVRPQALATAVATAAALEDTRAADNFRNLFETPVLFYAGVLTAYAAGLAGPALLAIAWAYAAVRFVHSAIHCTVNRVRYRFLAFVASFWLLAAFWALLAWDLLVAGEA